MKVDVFKCKLKEDKKDGSWVLGSKRSHKKEFEVVNPTPGDIANIKMVCDVKVSSREAEDAVEVETAEEIQAEDNSELIQFANDCWDLAVELKEKIEILEGSAEKTSKTTRKKKAK